MSKKYVVVEVVERDIATPRIYNNWEEANKDLCDCFAQVMGYADFEDPKFKKFIAPYVEDSGDCLDIGDYDDGWGLGPNMAYGETKNHDNFDIQIFEMDDLENNSFSMCATRNEEEEFDESAAWDDDSNRSCKDCPPEDCNGHCMSCYYRTV